MLLIAGVRSSLVGLLRVWRVNITDPDTEM